jgi:hypothetical protein
MRRVVTILLVVAGAMLAPTAAYAQASITGVVRDTSGAVIPSVTVEAASSALIEKVRSGVTDGSGQYRIIDLRAGTYSVTFSLAGFSTVIRQGIELSGSFSATVNAELRVGALEESITITGEAPIVDISSATKEDVLNRNLITSIPSARNVSNLANLIPAIVVSGNADVGGLRLGAEVTNFSANGGRGDDGHVKLDGMAVGGPVGGGAIDQGGGGTSYFRPDVGNAEEVAIVTSGSLGEAETGGPQINVIPRSGGNTPSGSFHIDFANSAMQGSNLSDELRALGRAATEDLIKMHDISGAFGGPIKRNRIWYFVTTRHQLTEKKVPLMLYNLNAGTNSWLYAKDESRPAFNDSRLLATNVRLTWQMTARQKISFYLDEERLRDNHKGGGTATTSPEAAPTADAFPQHLVQVAWQAPWTNRLLYDLSFSSSIYDYGGREREGNATRDLIRVTETGIQSGIQSVTYRSMDWAENHALVPRWKASVSYVTGAHSMKAGFEGRLQDSVTKSFSNSRDISYTFQNGVPTALTMRGSNPFEVRTRSLSQALFVQEQWTLKRLTLSTGLRYDYANSYYPEQTFGGTRFHPAVFVFPTDTEGGVTGFHDLNTRVNAVYDLTGDGKTSLKFNAGRYLDSAAIGGRWQLGNPLSRIQTTVGRSWNDANKNFVPDCNLLNRLAQDLRPSGGDQCGPWNNTTFGTEVFTTTYDPLMFKGWFTRPMEWGVGLSLQREVTPGMSVEVGWRRRWIDKWTLIHNDANTHADFTEYSVTAPVDPRLGDVSGRVVDDLWNISQAKFGLFDRHTILEGSELARDVNRRDWWHGVDFSVNARLSNGLALRGGGVVSSNGGDWCEYILNGHYGTGIPEGPGLRNCHNSTPVQYQLRAIGTYTIPRIDVQVAGTLTNRPGPEKSATVQYPAAVIAQSLGRPVSGNPATVAVNLFETGEAFYPQINFFDLRVGKILRAGRVRANVSVDIYNALNSSTGQTYNNTYTLTNPSLWGTPNLILPARFAKLALQIDF